MQGVLEAEREAKDQADKRVVWGLNVMREAENSIWRGVGTRERGTAQGWEVSGGRWLGDSLWHSEQLQLGEGGQRRVEAGSEISFQ